MTYATRLVRLSRSHFLLVSSLLLARQTKKKRGLLTFSVHKELLKCFVCLFFSSPSEKEMLVNDQDLQVLYEACSSKDCTKACNKEVGVTVVCLFFRRSFLDQLSSGTSCLKDFHHCLRFVTDIHTYTQ